MTGAALCRICGIVKSPWLAENGYQVHIGCIGKLTTQEKAQARRKGSTK